jgi:hypothetical protein
MAQGKRGRVVYRAAHEMRFGSNPIGGSNPPASARCINKGGSDGEETPKARGHQDDPLSVHRLPLPILLAKRVLPVPAMPLESPEA